MTVIINIPEAEYLEAMILRAERDLANPDISPERRRAVESLLAEWREALAAITD